MLTRTVAQPLRRGLHGRPAGAYRNRDIPRESWRPAKEAEPVNDRPQLDQRNGEAAAWAATRPAVTRRSWLGTAATAGVIAGGQRGSRGQTATSAPPLPWLEEVQRPPEGAPADVHLPPLVPEQGAAVTPPATVLEWQAIRGRIEKAWNDVLGPAPPAPPLAVEIVREEPLDGCRRRLVRYACEEGIRTEAYVLLPPAEMFSGPRRLPGLVAFHSTTDSTNECLAGLRDGPDRMLGLALARRGFVTICPRCFLWDDRTGYAEQVRRFQGRQPGALGMRKMLSDGSRALDVLAAMEGVDPDRLGCVGHSLGAKEAIYLAAFDRRVRAAVAHDGGLGRRQSNWDAVWYLGPDVPPMFDHHQLLALAASAAVLVQGGGRGAADGAASWPFVAAALPIHKLYGDSPRLGLDIHGGGHNLTDRAIARLTEWLDIWLAAPA